MGCAVNGPGEAGDADFGIAGGRDAGSHLRARRRCSAGCRRMRLVDELFAEIDALDRRRHAAARAGHAQARAYVACRSGLRRTPQPIATPAMQNTALTAVAGPSCSCRNSAPAATVISGTTVIASAPWEVGR